MRLNSRSINIGKCKHARQPPEGRGPDRLAQDLVRPTPVLSTEDPRAFEEIWAKVIQKLGPRDMIEQIFIWEGVVATWEMIRYNRHKTLMIQRKFRQCEAQQRAQVLRNRPLTDGHHAVDHPVARAPEENDHAQALESGINYFETLDTLQQRTIFRLNNALEQLEHYRVGLGLVLSRVAQEIIEGEFVEAADQPQPKQVAAPAPAAEEESKPVATPPIDFDEAQQDPKPVAAPPIGFDEAQQDPKPVATPPIGFDEAQQDPKPVAAPPIDFDEAQQDPKPVAAPPNDFDEAQQDPKPGAAPSIAFNELEDPKSVATPSIDSSQAQQEANLDAEASSASASEQPL
jgi:hypothetical protein